MERIIPEKETLTVEFKSDKNKLDDNIIFEAVVAFANTEGGDLYIGVEDNGDITGIHQSHKNTIMLSAYIANNTVPPVSVRVEMIDDVEQVVKISVPKNSYSIVATASGKTLRRRIKADGTPENVPMFPNEMSTRLSDLRLLDYSVLPLYDATLEDFDLLEIERLKSNILSYNGDKTLMELSEVDLFKALGFVKEEGREIFPTVCGILTIGKVESIKKFVPTHAVSFQVLEGTSVRVNEDFTLPILAAVEKLSSYIEPWNPENEIEMGLYRVSVPDFDRRAIREAVINAFSHRDYSKMGRVRVAFNDEGLTIANPGGFIEGVSVNNLLTAEPHGRNPKLADVLKRVGLAEKTGRGIDRIYEGSLIYGRLLPDYSASTSVTVNLFIPRSKPDSQIAKIITDEQNRLGRPLPLNTLLVLNMLKEMPRVTTNQLSEALNLSDVIVRNILDKAIDSGIVEGYGSGRGRKYILSQKMYKEKNKTIGYVRQMDIDESRYSELILSLAKSNEFISKNDVVELLHLNKDQTYRILKKMVERGSLEMVNKGKYAKYKIK
ncbi:MAG: AAA family ATPase [Ruminococcaceae bacterium]|nr:AAA family ATPase [Oscillospiraceae bacterium]